MGLPFLPPTPPQGPQCSCTSFTVYIYAPVVSWLAGYNHEKPNATGEDYFSHMYFDRQAKIRVKAATQI